jgi:hypothetical protein
MHVHVYVRMHERTHMNLDITVGGAFLN